MIERIVSTKILDVLIFERTMKRQYTGARSFSAISYRIKSNGKLVFADKTYRVSDGTVAVFPAGADYEYAGDYEKILVIHYAAADNSQENTQVFTPDDTEKYRRLFEQALEIWQQKGAGYKNAAMSVFYKILSELSRDGADENEGEDDRIYRAAEYISANIHDPELKISSVAEHFYMSDAYFRRKFRDRYGVSPKQYLDIKRIGRAKKLLESGYFTQGEISRRCGFSDVKYFRSAFSRREGMSASEYKKTMLSPEK